jgi:hypothetical protein
MSGWLFYEAICFTFNPCQRNAVAGLTDFESDKAR